MTGIPRRVWLAAATAMVALAVAAYWTLQVGWESLSPLLRTLWYLAAVELAAVALVSVGSWYAVRRWGSR